MYKAIKVIGEYGIGDVVPDAQAEAWLAAYAVPHVEKVKDVVKSVGKKVEVKKDTASDILEEYLSGSQSEIKKKITEDRLKKNQLEQLLKIETDKQNRPLILNTIKQKLRYVR